MNMPQTPPTCRPSKVAQPVTPSPPSTATAPRGAVSQQRSHSKVYRAGMVKKTPASRDAQPSTIHGPSLQDMRDRRVRTAPLHKESGEAWGHLGAPETVWEHQKPPPLLEPLPPLTRPFLQAHSTGINTRRWRTHIALPCTITMGAFSNCLSAKTLARRHNDPSEKWALIACLHNQPGLSHVHWFPSHGYPIPTTSWGSRVLGRVRGHGPGDSQAPGDIKK